MITTHKELQAQTEKLRSAVKNLEYIDTHNTEVEEIEFENRDEEHCIDALQILLEVATYLSTLI